MGFSDAERIEVQGYQLRDKLVKNFRDKKHCNKLSLPPEIKFQREFYIEPFGVVPERFLKVSGWSLSRFT